MTDYGDKRWTVHGERRLYDSPWIGLSLVDVELPDGTRLDHHVIRSPRHATGVIVHDADRGVLLLYRHRFITDTWGWEIPAGRVEDGESPAEAARREALEETGWEPGPVEWVTTFHPTNGLSDQTFHIFIARSATHVGPPSDPNEAQRVEWVPVDGVRRLIAEHRLGDGLSLTGISVALAIGVLQP